MSKKKSEGIERERRPNRLKAFGKRLLLLLGLYLDDLLFVAAGVCFTTAAGLAFGLCAALAVAGVCFLGYGIVVARARNGGDK